MTELCRRLFFILTAVAVVMLHAISDDAFCFNPLSGQGIILPDGSIANELECKDKIDHSYTLNSLLAENGIAYGYVFFDNHLSLNSTFIGRSKRFGISSANNFRSMAADPRIGFQINPSAAIFAGANVEFACFNSNLSKNFNFSGFKNNYRVLRVGPSVGAEANFSANTLVKISYTRTLSSDRSFKSTEIQDTYYEPRLKGINRFGLSLQIKF